MKLVNVWVVEGGWGNGSASFSAFDLRVEPTGWTLVDAEEPSVERQWSWQAMGGLEVVRGAGKTPDGRPATALDVIVNGWPVRVLVPSQDLTNETIEMLGAFAPVGHPLRASPKVKRESSLRRLSDAGRQFAGTRLRHRPVFLLSAASTRLRSALVVGVVLLVTVVVASIAGVATSAQTTTTTPPQAASGHGTTAPRDAGSVPDPTGDSPSAQVPGSSSAPTSVSPAVAASGSGSTTSAKASLTTGSTTAPGGGVLDHRHHQAHHLHHQGDDHHQALGHHDCGERHHDHGRPDDHYQGAPSHDHHHPGAPSHDHHHPGAPADDHDDRRSSSEHHRASHDRASHDRASDDAASARHHDFAPEAGPPDSVGLALESSALSGSALSPVAPPPWE